MEGISEEEFRRAIAGFKQFQETIGRFDNREDCLSYLTGATGLSREECTKAYDLCIKMDLSAFETEINENTEEEK